ncbi:hypothetical protein GCM10029992_18620 [Glycomyces albus]
MSTWLVGLYLVVANRFGVNANELFAGLSIIDQKCFLRIRINRDGATVFPVAIDRVGREWVCHPDGAATDSWLGPAEPLQPHLIEPGYSVSSSGPRYEPTPRQSPMRRLVAQAGEWLNLRG